MGFLVYPILRQTHIGGLHVNSPREARNNCDGQGIPMAVLCHLHSLELFAHEIVRFLHGPDCDIPQASLPKVRKDLTLATMGTGRHRLAITV
jgi:hypothetical protein